MNAIYKNIYIALVAVIVIIVLYVVVQEKNNEYKRYDVQKEHIGGGENVLPENGMFTLPFEEDQRNNREYTLTNGAYQNDRESVFLIATYPVVEGDESAYFVWIQHQDIQEAEVVLTYFAGSVYLDEKRESFVSDTMWNAGGDIDPGRISLRDGVVEVLFIRDGVEEMNTIPFDFF